jgi:hypothetical protein
MAAPVAVTASHSSSSTTSTTTSSSTSTRSRCSALALVAQQQQEVDWQPVLQRQLWLLLQAVQGRSSSCRCWVNWHSQTRLD